jgi:ABC-2 type transport system permease protein
MFAYLVLEVRRALRDGGNIFGIGMPVLLYLLFSNLGVDGDKTEAHLTLMIGMAAYGGIGAALGNGSTVATDKALGWLRQLRITPLSPADAVMARVLAALALVLPPIAAVLAAGALVNGVSLSGGQWAAIGLLLWLGTAPFALLGLGNGYHFSSSHANLANIGCNIVFAVIGGLWIPTEGFPDWLARIAAWTPGNGYGRLSWAVADGGAPALSALVSVTGWLMLFGMWALYAYRRAGRTA